MIKYTVTHAGFEPVHILFMPWANIVASRIKQCLRRENRIYMSGLYWGCIGRLVLKASYIIVVSGWVMFCCRFSDGLSVGSWIVGLAAYISVRFFVVSESQRAFSLSVPGLSFPGREVCVFKGIVSKICLLWQLECGRTFIFMIGGEFFPRGRG